MELLTLRDYEKRLRENPYVTLAGKRTPLRPVRVTRLAPIPSETGDVSTTVWSFPVRGAWGTHRSTFPGNMAPQIPRALIELYTETGDTVIDPMVGGGTTCIEAILLGRRCIGVDINPDHVMYTLHNIYWLREAIKRYEEEGILSEELTVPPRDVLDALENVRVYVGDASRLDEVPDGSASLVVLHPPYFNSVKYMGPPGDVSRSRSLDEYISMLRPVLGEARRVLARNGTLAVLVADTRVRGRYVPTTVHVLHAIEDTGLRLVEEVIKTQHNMRGTLKWVYRRRGFLLIAHEKLYIARKP